MKSLTVLVILSTSACAYSPSGPYEEKSNDGGTDAAVAPDLGHVYEEPPYTVPTAIGARCKIGGQKGVDWCWSITAKCWDTGIMRGKCSWDCAPIPGSSNLSGEEERCINAGGECRLLDNGEGWDNRRVCVPAVK